MTTHVEYNAESGRITRRMWPDKPPWFDAPKEGHEAARVEGFDQKDRESALEDASQIYEAGTDYDPEREMSVGYLVYDPDSGAIEPRAEIRTREDVRE